MVCVKRKFPLHVIEEQPLAQMLALEQFRIRTMQPSGNRSECLLVESTFTGCGWVLSRLRAPAEEDIEFDICWLGQRLRKVDKTGDVSLVDNHIGSMDITVDEDGFIGGEHRQPLPDPAGDIREQVRIMIGQSPGSLDLLESRTHDGWVERRPRFASECIGQPRRQQVGLDRNAVKCAQRNAETFDHRMAHVQVRRRPFLVQCSAGQAFGDIPRTVGPGTMRDVPGVRDLASGEQVDN